MIKYFIRHYWRYLAMALAFATITFLINSCEVKAETNYTQSLNLNYSENISSGDRILYNDPNHSQKPFANAGRGYLIGIIIAYRYGTSISFELPTLYSINARTDSGYSTCEVSSLANDMNDSTQMKANMYGFKCDLTMGGNGLISLSANFRPTVNNAFTVESYRVTFNNNLEAQQVSYTQYIYQYMQDWVYPRLQSIQNNTLGTYQELQYIYSYLQQYIYNKIDDLETAINSGNTQAHQDAQNQTQATNDINDSINDSSTDDPTNDINNMDSQVASNSVISDLLLLPVNMFQRILNSINGTCSSFSLGALFGTNLVLPCINIQNLIGSGLWTTIDILFCGIFILTIRKKFVDIFENITSLKDRGNELE